MCRTLPGAHVTVARHVGPDNRLGDWIGENINARIAHAKCARDAKNVRGKTRYSPMLMGKLDGRTVLGGQIPMRNAITDAWCESCSVYWPNVSGYMGGIRMNRLAQKLSGVKNWAANSCDWLEMEELCREKVPTTKADPRATR